MKLNLLLLFIFTSFKLFGGINPFDISTLGVQLKFEKAELNESDIVKMDFEMFNDILKEEYLSIDFENFQFVDIDFDGDKDLKYYGFVGAEPLGTIIFKNNNGKYEELITFLGSIYEIVFNKESNQVIFSNIVPPCCLSTEETFKINTVNLTTGKHEEKSFISLANTKFPGNYIEPFDVEILNKSYSLRNSPLLDKSEAGESNPLGGNLTATYSKGAAGTCYGIKTDNTGRDWFFVIMDSNSIPKTSIINYSPKTFRFFGWVSSNYIKISKNESSLRYCASISKKIAIEHIDEFILSIKKKANKESWSEENWDYIFPIANDKLFEILTRIDPQQTYSIELKTKIVSNFSPKYETYLDRITVKSIGCCEFELTLFELTKVPDLNYDPDHQTIIRFTIRNDKLFLTDLFFAG